MASHSISNGQLNNIKAWALKTGYPLENDIVSVLSEVFKGKTISLVRDHVFNAVDEEGQPKLRSIDLVCSYSMPHRNIPHRSWPKGPNELATLNFVIDAKYSTESWWFIPEGASQPKDKRFPYLIPAVSETVGHYETLVACDGMISAALANTGQPCASSGRKFQEGAREGMADYQVQLLQAVISLCEKTAAMIGSFTKDDTSYYRNIDIYVPINVTNATLFMLHDGISQAKIRDARSVEDFCDQIDELVLNQPNMIGLKMAFQSCEMALRRKEFGLEWLQQDLLQVPTLITTKDKLGEVVARYLSQFENELKKTAT